MTYIIEIDENGLITLTFYDDSIVQSKDMNEILKTIRAHYENYGNKGSIEKLLDL